MANITDAMRDLDRLLLLPEGWDYGRGGPISKRSHRAGAMLLRVLSQLGADEFDVVPGIGGGATIVSYHGEKSAEIHCRHDGLFDLLHEINDTDEQFSASLSLADLIFALEEFGWQSPRFYASCIRNATFRGSEGTQVSRSGTPPVVVYRWSAPTASRPTTRTLARTFGDTTATMSVETRRSSGEFRSLPFLQALA